MNNDKENQSPPSTGQAGRMPTITPVMVNVPSSAIVEPTVRATETPVTVAVPAAHVGVLIHRALRGRYVIIAALSLMLGGLCGYAGWRVGHPSYRSEGLIRIASSLKAVITETDQNQPMAMFDTFMQSQTLLISSRRVIDTALQDPIWRAGHTTPPDPEYIAERLTINIKPRSEYIQIVVTDGDPALAAAAVTSIVNAYADLYNTQDKHEEGQRLGVLEEKQQAAAAKIASLRTQMAAIAKEFGTEKLDSLFDAAMARVTKFADAISDYRVAEAGAAKPAVAPAGTEPSESPLSVEQIAALDPSMRELLNEQAREEDSLAQLRLRLGAAHPTVVAANAEFDRTNARIAKYAETFRQFRAATAQNLGDPERMPIALVGKPLATLQQNEAALQKLLADAKQEMMAIGSKRLELQRLSVDLDGANAELLDYTHRIETLSTEASFGGRLSIISTGELALTPAKDTRIRMAAAGGLAGFCLPVGVFFLVGFLGRRYRYSDETSADIASRFPMLGILPRIGKAEPSSEQMLSAARCVHQIRVRLLANPPINGGNGCRVYMVSSAGPGEGKTSVTIALGLSFASAGYRTLLIDGDWIGRGLTRRFRAEDKPGLCESLKAGDPSVAMSYPLLAGAGGRGTLQVLTSGHSDVADAYSISQQALHQLLQRAKREFDIVLIDTGPILGSVEASILAQEVDSVIFTIKHGQNRSSVAHAVGALRGLGTPVAGFIFNQARDHDFRASGYGSTTHSSPRHTLATQSRADRLKDLFDLGPLATAVGSQLPGDEDVN
jgi:Mrp family chromosome partitioning ATPase/uncharacterized protein involved in exopolysaccharide biosynthesis